VGHHHQDIKSSKSNILFVLQLQKCQAVESQEMSKNKTGLSGQLKAVYDCEAATSPRSLFQSLKDATENAGQRRLTSHN